ncbi:MAG: GNAT family N-acetyltransferase [Gammaproteobacteria bacterium]|nr:GNAT family N-acetyltransferase [Gammaproteobacteria bacterium]
MLAFHHFTAKDLEPAAKAYVSCFNAPPWDDEWTVNSAKQRLETLLQFPGAVGLVATQDSKIIGLVIGHCEPWSDGQHFYLNEMCIDPAQQRSRVGEALLDELFQVLRAQDISSVYLLTDVGTGAASFYRKNRFEDAPSSVKLWRDL